MWPVSGKLVLKITVQQTIFPWNFGPTVEIQSVSGSQAYGGNCFHNQFRPASWPSSDVVRENWMRFKMLNEYRKYQMKHWDGHPKFNKDVF